MAVKKSGKVVKKRWFNILAPSLLKEAKIGETYISDPEAMIGKKMTVSLGSITGEPQKHNTHINLIIKSFDDGVFKTDLLGWRVLPAAVKKMVRRNRSRIDDSFVIMAKDGQYVRIKPLIVTRTKAQRSAQTSIRQKVRVEVAKVFSERDFKIIAGDILGKRFQHSILRSVAKLFPVQIFEIRQLVLIDAEKAKKLNIVRFVGEKRKESQKKPKQVKKPEEKEKPKEK